MTLPQLPEPAQEAQSSGFMPGCPIEIPATPDLYTADQMQAYAVAAVATYRDDAERYRWLRAQHWTHNTLAVVVNPRDSVLLGSRLPSDAVLDASIDEAMTLLPRK